MLVVGWFLKEGDNSLVDSAMVNGLLRRRWSPDDLLSSLHNSLQKFAVPHSGVAIPHSDAAGQDALINTAVVVEDLSRHAKLPQEVQPLLCAFLTSCVALSVQVRSSLMWIPRYLKLLTLSPSSSWISSG